MVASNTRCTSWATRCAAHNAGRTSWPDAGQQCVGPGLPFRVVSAGCWHGHDRWVVLWDERGLLWLSLRAHRVGAQVALISKQAAEETVGMQYRWWWENII